jgi:hypothetical protein
MFKSSFLFSLAALFFFPFSFPVLSAPKYLPYYSPLFELNFPGFDPAAVSSSVAAFESYLNKVISPINYCGVCGYFFEVEVYGRGASYDKFAWHPWNTLYTAVNSASPHPSKCSYVNGSTRQVTFSAADGLANIVGSINNNGDREIRGFSVVFLSRLSPYFWNSRGCGNPFDDGSPSTCPNFRVRSLPAVRVRIRC